jgi:hypothetical protein
MVGPFHVAGRVCVVVEVVVVEVVRKKNLKTSLISEKKKIGKKKHT